MASGMKYTEDRESGAYVSRIYKYNTGNMTYVSRDVEPSKIMINNK